MANTTVNLGMLPQNRGEYSSSATYYKDNIVQYNGSSYICTAAMDLEHPSGITGVAPYDSDPATPNTGWAVFSNDSSGVGEGVYNVSVDHTTDNQPKVYASLSAALNDIPAAKQKGGMNIKFIQGTVQNNDNKYAQYRYILSDATTVATFTNVANWRMVGNGITDKIFDFADFLYEPTALSFKRGKPSNTGILEDATTFITSIFDVSKQTHIIVYNNDQNISAYGILFSTDLSFNNISHGFSLYDGPNTYTRIVVPEGALYAAIDVLNTNGKVYFPKLSDVGNIINSLSKIEGVLPKSLSTPLTVHSTVKGYPSTSTGKIYQSNYWTTNIYDVSNYNYIVLRHNCNDSVYGIELGLTTNFVDTALIIRTLTYNTTDGSTSDMFIDVRGMNYLAIYSSIDLGVFDGEDFSKNLFNELTNIEETVNDIDKRFLKISSSILDSVISGCYPRLDTHSLYSSPSFNTRVYNVSGVSRVCIKAYNVNTTYYGIAFSTTNDNFNSSSVWKAYPGSGTYTGSFFVDVPDGKLYMAIDEETTIDVLFYEYDPSIISETESNLDIFNKMFLSGKYGKTCLYIGDSISTNDAYHWKGYLRDKYNVPFVIGGSTPPVNPAEGGISVIPPEVESDDRLRKSIWYRCAGNRMSYFTFDFISLFGGTNDMNVTSESDMTLGSVNDTPYVDTLTGFDEGKATELTAIRPETLTFAASLMGCIEMLHRDFPDKQIVLSTVMPCYGGTSYGNLVDANGIRLSERMAELQMQIAAKYSGDISAYASTCNYGVIAVPLYWNIRTHEGAKGNVLSYDGVHPNKACGKRMADFFAKVLDLR